MARPARIEYGSALYHIVSRGKRQDKIFTSDEERVVFVEKLNYLPQRTRRYLKVKGVKSLFLTNKRIADSGIESLD